MFDIHFWLGFGAGIIVGATGLIAWAMFDSGKEESE